MFIKICGITNEEDALLAVAVGADAIGFVFAPSPRQVAVTRVSEIVKRLPPDVLTVGVFRNELPDRVISIVNNTGLMAAQLHGFESATQVQKVKSEVRTVFKAVTAGSESFQDAAAFGADAVLVDSDEPGSGEVFDWKMAENAPQGVPLILAGGLTPSNVAGAIRKVQPWGVDVSTGVERSPGLKDPILVRAFIEAARSTENNSNDQKDEINIFREDPYNWEDDPTWR